MKLNVLKHALKYENLIKNYNGNWCKIAHSKDLPLDFIDEYFFKLLPYNIQFYQRLSPYLLFKYGDNLNWKVLSKTHDLPEILIRKYITKINWWYISEYQNMNNEFIREFQDKLIPEKLLLNRYLVGNPILKQLKLLP